MSRTYAATSIVWWVKRFANPPYRQRLCVSPDENKFAPPTETVGVPVISRFSSE
jgi:hypothetical protein